MNATGNGGDGSASTGGKEKPFLHPEDRNVSEVEFAVKEEKRTALHRAGRRIQIVWATSIMSIATVAGVYIGWHDHGIGGAIGLGIAGLIIGGVLSASPSLLFSSLS